MPFNYPNHQLVAAVKLCWEILSSPQSILGARSLAGFSGAPQLRPRLVPSPRTVTARPAGRDRRLELAGSERRQKTRTRRELETSWSAAPASWPAVVVRWGEGKVVKMLAVPGTVL